MFILRQTSVKMAVLLHKQAKVLFILIIAVCSLERLLSLFWRGSALNSQLQPGQRNQASDLNVEKNHYFPFSLHKKDRTSDPNIMKFEKKVNGAYMYCLSM